MSQANQGDRVGAIGIEHAAGERGFRGHLRDAIPLATSLVLHAAVIVIGILTARAIQVAKSPEPVEIQAGAAVTDFQESDASALAAASLTSEDDPTRPPAQDQVTNTPPDGWASVSGPNPLPTLDSPGDPGPADTTIGLSATDALNPRHTSSRTGPGDGGGGGGPLMPFGPPGSKVGRSIFDPPKPTVRTVVFVCDASGSMIQTFTSLKAELTKAVTNLANVKGFNIVFFQDEKAASMDPSGGLVLATPENKRKAFMFLEDVSTSGTTNPIPGLQVAFKSKPQLIYLLTDGDFPDNAAVLSTIRRLNAAKQTKVNTIAFTSGDASDELSKGFIELMKTIAQENGGTFRLVRENEL